LRRLIAITACLLGLALVWGCGDSDGHKPAAPKARAVEPLDLALHLSPGAAKGQAVALVRLYSRAAQQKALDNRRKPQEQREKIEPISLAGGEELWVKSLRFVVEPLKGSQGLALSPGQGSACRAMRFPKAAELTLGPTRAHGAVYQLDAPDKLAPGSRIKAVLRVQGREIASPSRVMPDPPKNPGQAALRQARTARWLDDAQAMLAAGRELIQKDPAAVAGYWYQGLALEKQGQEQPALASYEQAWDKWRQSVKNQPHPEPPMRLARRMARLRAKLGLPPPNPAAQR